MIKHLHLWQKIIGGLILASALPVTLLSFYHYQNLRELKMDLELERMEDSLQQQVTEVNSMLHRAQDQLLIAREDPQLKEKLSQQNLSASQSNLKELGLHMNTHWKTWLGLQEDLLDIILLNNQSEVVFSMSKEPLNSFKSNELKTAGSFDQIRFGTPFSSHLPQTKDVFRVILSAPIVNESSNKIGTIALEINADKALAILQAAENKNSLFKTGILQIADDGSQEITPIIPLFEDAPLNTFTQQIKGREVIKTTSTKQNILAVWHPIPALQWTAVITTDAKAILSPLKLELSKTLILSLLLIAFIGVAGYFYARSIARRLEQLKVAAERISQGSLNVQIPATRHDEIDALARAFNAMTNKLATKKRENIQQKDLVALAAHQLRTPLNRIKWVGQSLQKGKAGQCNKEQRELLGQAVVSAGRMNQTISTILTLSNFERDAININIAEFDLKPYLQEILGCFEPEYKQKEQSLKLTCKQNLKIKTDRNLLGQILENIIGNAFKYTPEKGKVTVKATQTKSEIKISIADTGFGIPRDQEEKIFAKFYRADTEKIKRTAGTGLGLHVVKILLNIIKGSIHFTSKENQGTNFVITLPRTLNL